MYIYAIQLQNALTPTLGFVRVRELVNGRLGKVFKQPQHTIRYTYIHVHTKYLNCAYSGTSLQWNLSTVEPL